MFLQCLNTSLITVPLPKISEDLGITVSESSWLLLAYSLGTCAFLLQFAKYGRNNRIRFFFLYGIMMFIVSSGACAVINDFAVLTIMRFIQGAGIAMSAATCPLVVIHRLPEERRGYALGSMASGTGLAMVLGPSLGGILSEIISWHYLFLINVPLAVIVLAVSYCVLPSEGEPDEKKDPDALGSICWFVVLAAGMVFLENITVWNIRLLLPFATAAYLAMFLLAFRLTDNGRRQPILSPGLVKNRTFVLISVSAVLGSMITEGALYLLPYFMQISWGMTVNECGLYFVIVSVSTFIAANFVGGYCDSHSAKGPVLMSFAVTLIFDAVFAVMNPDWVLALLIVSACMVGISFAVFETAQYIRMINHAKPEYRDEAATMITVLTYIGASLGLIAYSLTFTAAIPEAAGIDIDDLSSALMTEGFNATGILGLVLGIVGILAAAIVKDRKS